MKCLSEKPFLLMEFLEIYVYEIHFLIQWAAGVGPDKFLCLISCIQRSKQKDDLCIRLYKGLLLGIDLISNIQTKWAVWQAITPTTKSHHYTKMSCRASTKLQWPDQDFYSGITASLCRWPPKLVSLGMHLTQLNYCFLLNTETCQVRANKAACQEWWTSNDRPTSEE